MTGLSAETPTADAVQPLTSAGHTQLGTAVPAGTAVIVLCASASRRSRDCP
ncbi:hypothetical protein [Streptomyces sp. NPDC001508]|uniref:hypothetical protein n=1 Tax=Streptomyces sp. NPDC001508 TaxID=3154656 RepID=UPI003330C23B